MKNNLLRGKLLKLLHEMYPDSMELSAVIGIYYQYHPVEDIRRALQYLEDKGFICEHVVSHPYREGKNVIYFKISPAGVDLVEGNNCKDEPGVVLPREELRG